MLSEGEIAQRVAAVRERICAAAGRAGRRPDEVTLVAVAKRVAPERVLAAARAGVGHVAENYVQEALDKIPKVQAALEGYGGTPPPRWHFVGQLQRNKARRVVERFDVVETVDRESLGTELEQRAARAGRSLDVLLQVNLSREPQKGGVAPESLPQLLAASAHWAHLRTVGLMTIPAWSVDPEASRPVFAQLRALRDCLQRAPGAARLRELSMGMSGDYEVAIEEGATIVRVGTAIFGPRPADGEE